VITLLEAGKSVDEVAVELQSVLGPDWTAKFCDWLDTLLSSPAFAAAAAADNVDDAAVHVGRDSKPAASKRAKRDPNEGDDDYVVVGGEARTTSGDNNGNDLEKQEEERKKNETKRLYTAFLKSGFKGDFNAYKVFVGTSWDKKQDLSKRLASKSWHRVRDGPPEVRLDAPLMAERTLPPARKPAVAATEPHAPGAHNSVSRPNARGAGRGGRGRGAFDSRVGVPTTAAAATLNAAGTSTPRGGGGGGAGRGSKNLTWVRTATAAVPADPLDLSLPKTPPASP